MRPLAPKGAFGGDGYRNLMLTPEQYRIILETYPKNTHRDLKIQFLQMYGSKCSNEFCSVPGGEDDPTVLTLDHINGGGEHARRKLWAQGYKSRGSDYAYKEAVAVYNPDKFRVLCWSCQHKTKLYKGLRGGGHAYVKGEDAATHDPENYNFGMFENIQEILEPTETSPLPKMDFELPPPEFSIYKFGLFADLDNPMEIDPQP